MARRLRLLADDLTGALDSAARFVPVTGPVCVMWRHSAPDGSVAVDTGTRDLPEDTAAAAMQRFAPLLEGGDPVFKKVDSLLRGHVAAELAACLAWFDHCVLAPAFPSQGRITRHGRQLVRSAEGWRDTGVDLRAQIRGRGLPVRVIDAETDADLDAIVAAGHHLSGRILWCGTGGLAGALAGRAAVPRPTLPAPILALIGSDHSVSLAQVSAVPARFKQAIIRCELESGIRRCVARAHICAEFVELLRRIERPGTLFVTGGQTLRDLCDALGATSLMVDGEIEPGVPTSIMCGGAWNGQRLVSKSGAFGDTGFLTTLLGEGR